MYFFQSLKPTLKYYTVFAEFDFKFWIMIIGEKYSTVRLGITFFLLNHHNIISCTRCNTVQYVRVVLKLCVYNGYIIIKYSLSYAMDVPMY